MELFLFSFLLFSFFFLQTIWRWSKIGFCVNIDVSYIEFLPAVYTLILTFGGGVEGTYAWIKCNKKNNNEAPDAAPAAAAAATVPPYKLPK